MFNNKLDNLETEDDFKERENQRLMCLSMRTIFFISFNVNNSIFSSFVDHISKITENWVVIKRNHFTKITFMLG